MVSIPPQLPSMDLDYLYDVLPETQKASHFQESGFLSNSLTSIEAHSFELPLVPFFTKTLALSPTDPQLWL